MSEFRTRAIDEESLDTVLAEDCAFEGEMQFVKPLLVKGRVTGTISSEGDLYVSKSAHVEAQIDANVVSVKGRVSGKVTARTRVELFADAGLDGDIVTPDFVMQSGSRFNGTCRMPTGRPATPA